jgi:hypothetical protein
MQIQQEFAHNVLRAAQLAPAQAFAQTVLLPTTFLIASATLVVLTLTIVFRALMNVCPVRSNAVSVQMQVIAQCVLELSYFKLIIAVLVSVSVPQIQSPMLYVT